MAHTSSVSVDVEETEILSHEVVFETPISTNNQFSPSVGASTDESILPTSTQSESAKPDHEVVRESFLKEFPSLDSVAAEGINTHEIPTFNEFHAMISEGSRSRKDQDCEAQNVDVLNSKYDTKTEQEINSAPSSIISEKLPQTHIDTNPSVKSSKGQLVQEVLDRAVLSDSGSSSDVIVTDPSSDQHQPLKGNSIVTSNAEINPKSSSHVTPQPVTTSATTTTRTVADNDALHTPSKMDLTLRRNVASVACGAKMLGSSKAIKNPEAVLNENNDEYMNVPCSEDKWLILEVCQPVQLRTIELANFELFSSRLKSFRVYANDRYPAKSWELIGTFTARDVKGIQSFSVISGKMIKYIKFELIEHYGSEHYCPLTMIRIFGLGSDDLDDDDDVDDIDVRLMNVPDTSSNHESIITSTNGGDQQQSENETTTLDYDHAKNNHKDGRTQQDTLSGSTSGTMEQTEEKRNHIQSSVSYHNEVNLSTHDDQATKKINSDSTMKSSHLNPLSDEHHSNNHNDDGDELSTGSNISSFMDLSTSSHTGVTSNHHQSSDIKNHDKYKLTTTDRQNIEHQSSNNNKNDTNSNNNKFCGKVGPVKLFGTEFCPAETVHPSMIHINNNDYSVSDKKSRFSPMTDTKMPTETKLPHVVRIKQPNNYPLQNKSTLNLTSQLSSELFNEVVNEMSLFSRLSNAIKRTLFNTISLFFPSTQDHSGNYLNLHDIVPTSENFHTINYLFNPHGFSNLLCKGSMMYLTVDQIEGLWHLRKCLILLDHHQQRQQSSIDSQSLPVDSINPTNLDACSRAVSHLNLTLIINSQHHQSSYELDKSIGHLLIAYQTIKRSKSFMNSPYFFESKLPSFLSLYDISYCEPLDWSWKKLNILLWNNTAYYKCFKLPSFLLSVKHSESLSSSTSPHGSDLVDSTDNDVDDEKVLIGDYHHSADIVISSKNVKSSKSLSSSSSSSPIKSHNTNHPHSREALVVPAALSGSRKSTAFMRLNNRVRIIERNVSVSMRYLEELSQSYRRQMERLSRSFNLTYAWLKVTAQSADERDRQQQHRITQLELQLNDFIARFKPLLLNSPSSSNQEELTSSTTATPATTTSSSSSSGTAPTNLGSAATISTTPKSSNLVSTSLSPPPLPDFENSLDWNPWLKSQHDDWNNIVDGDAVVGSDADDMEFESDDSYTHDDIYLPRLGVFSTNTKLSKSQKDNSKQTLTTATLSSRSHVGGVGSSNSHSSGSSNSRSDNPNEYNAKSLLYQYSSTRNKHHKESFSLLSEWKHFISSWLWLQFSWPVWLYDCGMFIYEFSQMNTVILNMFGLVFLHLTLASIVHFLIYWVWLRPKSHMLSTKFDTDLLLSSLFRVLCCNNKSHHQKYGNLVLYFNPISSTSSSPTTHLLPSTNTSTTINTNPCTTDNLSGCDIHQNDDKNQSLIKESNTIRHNTTINSNIDDNLRPKSFTCCQLNDLFHAYKSSIEINHNHLFKKVHQNSIISVYDQCTIDNVDSCCLTKKNEGDRIQDSDLLSSQDLTNYNGALMHQPFILNKCRPQHAQSCSSAQSPTYCLPSESSQFSKDKLKYEENDCLHSNDIYSPETNQGSYTVSSSDNKLFTKKENYNDVDEVNDNSNINGDKKPTLTSIQLLTNCNLSTKMSKSLPTTTLNIKTNSKSTNTCNNNNRKKRR
ncbi:SUN domain-containing ossification factor [Schistosoma japonicum]|nr:SUN domain-containing ossification factor [Schistosoma japonicum]